MHKAVLSVGLAALLLFRKWHAYLQPIRPLEGLLTQKAQAFKGGVAHIYTVGRSATGVKLKVNSQFKIFLKLIGQAATFL